ncbi:MAG: methylated-DNA--[protein]-cysteine S-methyltransferase [Alcanivoracaceae bacterium]|nr:methylated-DNA--[protein]-cysteine S-methyltransferase [Alcanivoracaceae bacterium]
MTNNIQYWIYSSPVGKLLLAGDDNGLQKIQFEINISVDDNWQKNQSHFKQVIQQLDEYFAKQRTLFDLKLNPQGTDFQRQVWKQLQKIEYGKTKYYAEIANEINSPKAARAIGMANNKNPIPIIIPCHRVIGKNGSLTGFAGGLDVKQQLLSLEFSF